MSASAPKAEVDVAEEQRRIDSALDAGLPHASERFAACHTCGATPGNPCVNQGPGQGILSSPHRRRIDDYFKYGPATPLAGTALATTPDTYEVARSGLQQAVKAQILAFCDQEITAKTLDRLQRFCASMGQAMIGIERPDALVRDRFGRRGINAMYMPATSMSEDDEIGTTLAPAPLIETYGANASRGLIAEAAAIGKDLMVAQAKAQAEARKPNPPSMTDLVYALAEAKKQKLPKKVLQALEKQIDDLVKTQVEASAGGA